ncbi:T9SS type A sorting domain-containing protein [Aureibaculum luteum]|uniref:T9SS type A sorting domain-containing protein n=1 Tax=Aureibaculum luteum TaxID=1548456 RepID=UPI000E474DDB|nr:T9SS type A sorting domain-containing protein [Aureibaculum luteum]
MKTKLLLLFSVLLFVISVQGQNTITIVDPPTSVEANTNVDITFNYTIVEEAYAYIRFKDAGNLTEISAKFSIGTGTATLSLPIPDVPPGDNYSFQAQLFSTGWSHLATEDITGITVKGPSNSISMIDPPTTVMAGTDVDITFDYITDQAEAHVYIRLKDADGNVSEISDKVTDNSGTLTLSLPIPADELGTGYSYQAQIFTTDWTELAKQDIGGITVEKLSANSITIVDPPTTVIVGEMVDITLSYTKDIAVAYALIRFKNTAGDNLEQKYVEVTDDAGSVTLSLEAPVDVGNDYSYQAQLISGDFDEILDAEVVEGIIVKVEGESNSITMVDPPTTVTAGTNVDITFNYTTDLSTTYAFIRFRDANGNLTDINDKVDLGSGSKTLSLQIPASALGTGYSYQAQLFSSTDWGTSIAAENIEGITVETGVTAPNSITMVNPPTTVIAGTNVDITFNYSTDLSTTYAFIRFRDANGNLSEINDKVDLGSGSKTFSLPIPADELGTGYSYQAQLFSSTDWSSSIATENIEGITVETGVTVTNSITMVDPPTTVTAGTNVDITFNYTLNIDGSAFIRFKDANNLTEISKVLSAGSGTETLSLKIPASALGTGYSYQAQLFDHNNNYAHLATEDVTDITVEAYVPTGENTLEIVDTSTDPINNGTLRRVNIKYNLLQTSKILVEVRDNEVAAGSNKIGEVWVELPPGNDTVGLDLIVDNGWPGETNRIQAVLFEGGTTWGTIAIPEIPYIVVGKGDGTITYRGQPSADVNTLFSQDLGDGYWTNYYIADGWKGPIQMNFGTVGSPSWIEYENQNVIAEGHKEFDIKIQKFSWHDAKDTSVDRGYPKALKDIDFPLNTAMEGQWSPESGGKGQLNMTAWVTENGDMSGNRVDIIVHTFHNGGKTRIKYDNNTEVDNHVFNNIGEFTANNGLTYQILRTLPGYLGEVASYNLVPDAIVQADPTADYTTDIITANVDMKDIIDNLIAKEAAYTGTKVSINDTWQINGLEWTVVGQSENTDSDGQLIPSGHGKFTFNSYLIPDLVKSLGTDDFDLTLQNLTIYPNPFTDSFTYEYDSNLSDEVTVELFTVDGRKVKMIKNNDRSYGNNRTINTEHLSNGMYIVRITSGDVQETRKLLKI